jgi:AraC-like DNA-binding protein
MERVIEALKMAVQTHARQHANADGLALTPVPGLRMMSLAAPGGPLQSTYKPLVCLVLQGAKHMMVGNQEQVLRRGQSIIVSADMPVSGRIIEASRNRPYLAVAVEIDRAILREVAELLPLAASPRTTGAPRTSFVEPTVAPLLDCARRLLELLHRPDAIPILRPAIMRELHYWLLSGKHGQTLAAMVAPESHAARLAAAVRILREEYRAAIRVDRLASAAAMSLTAFHQHFKKLTSLTPIQYQKRLRLIEARQLMESEGWQAGRAAFEVGYESISQFTREYRRLFGAPPKRDALSRRSAGNARLPDRGTDHMSAKHKSWQ